MSTVDVRVDVAQSEITAPTFCRHSGKSEPLPITRMTVIWGEKVNDERIEWLESGYTDREREMTKWRGF